MRVVNIVRAEVAEIMRVVNIARVEVVDTKRVVGIVKMMRISSLLVSFLPFFGTGGDSSSKPLDHFGCGLDLWASRRAAANICRCTWASKKANSNTVEMINV